MQPTSTLRLFAITISVAVLCMPTLSFAFDSGSTGADGTFTPTVDTQLPLPPDGVFNYTDVDIPAGVTVTFLRNATNTPVTMLASGDVTIAGTIDLSGGDAIDTGAAGDGNLGDDGIPGVGGPGGFDGGRGGSAGSRGSDGIGPGGGVSGGGGGFGTAGGSPRFFGAGPGGPVYGSDSLLPLIGGSGGAGGSGNGAEAFGGSGGGGGGGAILIAASGTVDITGSIVADGGIGGTVAGPQSGGPGGGGAGGGIRIVATTISGNGAINARGGGRASGIASRLGGGGGTGRVRLEAENFQRTSNTTPVFVFSEPGSVFVAGLPTLLITSVAGMPAPAAPTGDADIALPADTPNPVTVEFATTSVPVGNTVTLKVLPVAAAAIVAVSSALSGSEASATANVAVNLPDGPSILSATVSFTVTASLGDALRNFAQGERVERVELAASPGADSLTTLVTVSGKTYTLPSTAVAGL